MKQKARKAIALLLTLAILCGMLVIPAGAETAATPIAAGDLTDGKYTVTAGGTYQLAEGLTGTIQVHTTEPVTIVGNGAQWNSGYAMTSTPHVGLYFDCTYQAGVHLTLKDIYISNNMDTRSITCEDGTGCGIVGVTGTGNTLDFEGVCVLDLGTNAQGSAGIHVKQGDSLTIGGGGTLYYYKSEMGAGVGGSWYELNGDITFRDLTMFAKGTKQGALIGTGADASKAGGNPGSITFESGTYNLIANARGAAIGGGAGDTGASAGTNVYIKGGSININVNYTGAAIGGGGYKNGNDASGGTVYITGGSLRIYTGANVASEDIGNVLTGYNGEEYVIGTVNDAPMTARRLNSAGENVYRCLVDTTNISPNANGEYIVKVDGAAFYTGGLHEYYYLNETIVQAEETEPISTPSNWLKYPSPSAAENNLFLYLTGESHTIEINNVKYRALWDGTSGSFTVTPAYNVTVAGSDNGTVSVSAISAAEGESVTITAVPNLDYELDTITVTKDGDEAVIVNGNTFTMPACNVTVTVTFKEDSWYDDGTAAGYVIDTAKELCEFASIVNGTAAGIATDSFAGKTVTLDADIDLSGIGEWPSIGNGSSNAFAGTFDGNGHTVSGLNVNTTGYAGLFGYVTGTIQNLEVSGSVNATGPYAGGVVAWLSGGTVSGVASHVDVTGTMFVGGIAGNAGGGGTILNCYNTGDVTGTMQVGGIVGNGGDGTVRNCYNTGVVGASIALSGGIIGNAASGTILNSYYLSAEASDDMARTADEMKTVAFAALLGSDYNGDTSTGSINSGYPVLNWQGGRPVCTVTLSAGEGCTINAEKGFGTEMFAGDTFKFTVTVSKIADEDFKTVVKAGGTTLTPDSNGIYTITVHSDVTITAETAELQTYTVTFVTVGADPDADPIALSVENPCEVMEGGNLSFQITCDEKYKLESVVNLTEGRTELQPIGDAYYITEINEDIYVLITVSNASYTVTLPENGEGYTIAALGKTTVAKGETFEFIVTAAKGYQINSVKANEQTLAPDEDGIYTLAVTENVTITVEAKKKVLGGDPEAAVWDGETIDVSWFTDDPHASTFYITYPAELAGLAALVNGIYNEDIKYIYGDEAYIVAHSGVGEVGANNKATEEYQCGAYDFSGKTIYLCADIDMGAGNNYMPIGGQYLMTDEDTTTKIDASFNGVLDGQGHSVTIYCDRHCSLNYGDGQSVGLIGRLGCHDNDPTNIWPTGAGVYNLAVYGSIKANRSVGAVVGKIGKTNGGGTIANCANFASVYATDAKGTGGICGAAWNGGEIRNCYNAGTITSTFTNSVGGIAGSCEISLVNCYNVGTVIGPQTTTAAITTNNGGTIVENCYWLTGSADVGVYGSSTTGAVEKTSGEMKSEEVLLALGSAFVKDTGNINNGYPVFAWQVTATAGTVIKSTTTVNNGVATTTVTADDVSASVAAAQKAKADTLYIITDTVGVSANQTIAEIPKSAVMEIAAASLSLSVQTADGSTVTIPSGILSAVAGKAAGTTVTLTVTPQTAAYAKELLSKTGGYENTYLTNSVTVSVGLSSGGVEINSFTSNISMKVPVDSKNFQADKTYDVLVVSSDGTVSKLSGTCVSDGGQLYVSLNASRLGALIVLNQAGAVVESTTTVKDGVATTVVTENAVSASVAAAQGNKEDTLYIITDTDSVSVNQTTVEIPKSAVKEIAAALLSLSVETADGSRVTMPPAVLSVVADSAMGATVELTAAPQTEEYAGKLLAEAEGYENTDLEHSVTLSIGLSSGGVAISGLTADFRVEIPVGGEPFEAGKTYDVLQVLGDGTVNKLSGTCVADGEQQYVSFSVSSPGTFVVLKNVPIIYDDVNPADWFYEAVTYVTELGLMNGVGNNLFAPNGTMTRAMLVTVLYRLENSPAAAAANIFNDVPDGTWYTGAVNWAGANKIIEGYGNNTFGPEDNVTREQIATILYRYMQYPGLDASARDSVNQFTDSGEISAWAYEGMQWAVGTGIMEGYETGMVNPGGDATRAEVATMLQRFINLIVQ